MKLSFRIVLLALSAAVALALGVGTRTPLSAERISDDEYDEVEDKADDLIDSGKKADVIRAIRMLAATDHEDAVKTISDVFRKNKDTEIKRKAAQALGSFTSPAALEQVVSKTRRFIEAKSSRELFYAYLILRGMARTTNEDANKVVKKLALDDLKKDPYWANMAALEAIADSRDSRWLDVAVEILRTENDDWAEEYHIVPLSAINAVAKCTTGQVDLKAHIRSLEALTEAIERYSKPEHDRIRYLAAHAIWEIANFKRVLGLDSPTDNVVFLKYYISGLKTEKIKRGEKIDKMRGKSRTTNRPTATGIELPGRKIVFCVDVSSSMKEKVDKPAVREIIEKRERRRSVTGKGGDDEKEDEKKDDQPKLPWDIIETKLDLAREVLKLTLDQLVANEDTTYYINIVTYHTKSSLLDEDIQNLVKCDSRQAEDFKTLLDELDTQSRTNIHGALRDAFQITMKEKLDDDVDTGLSPEAILHGADSIYFLTDGWSNMDDFSGKNERVQDRRWPDKDTHTVGTGPYVYGQEIVEDFIRMNKFRKVVVNTVGIGNHDVVTMERLAKLSNGTYLMLGRGQRIEHVPESEDGEKKKDRAN